MKIQISMDRGICSREESTTRAIAKYYIKDKTWAVEEIDKVSAEMAKEGDPPLVRARITLIIETEGS